MKVIVLGAGDVGTATPISLAGTGCEVEVVERQNGAALETSFGNGGVIHAGEVVTRPPVAVLTKCVTHACAI